MYGVVCYRMFYHSVSIGSWGPWDRDINEYCGYWVWVLRINSVQPDIVSITIGSDVFETFSNLLINATVQREK